MEYISGFKIYVITGLIMSLIVLLISEINLKRKKEQTSGIHKALLLVLGLYLSIIFSATVSPVYGFSISGFGENINLIPFKVISHISNNPLNFYGNILMFIPIGIILVLLSYKCQKLHITVFAGMRISILIEVIQLFESRGTDIDDVILNTIGTLVGYLLGRYISLKFPLLRQRLGVIKKIDGKYRRRLHDTGKIKALCTILVISVICTGFAERNSLLQNGITTVDNYPEISDESLDIADEEMLAELKAKNIYLLNTSTNKIVYERASQEKIAPASTTKMLTALTVLDYCDLQEEVRVGNEVRLIAENASRAWLYPGNKLTVEQLLDGLLLPSGNDAAYALAVYTGRKITKDESITIEEALAFFIEEMNKKAVNLGALKSNFESPDGYDTQNQYTTAKDLALIAKTFIKCRQLRNIVGSNKISDRWISGENVTYENTNELINPNSPYYYKQAIGLKTGTSENAGYCLVSAAEIQGDIYIGVVMGSTEEGRWEDSLTLYNKIEQRKGR